MKNYGLDDFKLAQDRTLLAAERTLSAWLRTALAGMASGLAIVRFIHFKTELHKVIAHAIGEMLIFWALLLVIIASVQYRKTCRVLTHSMHYKNSLWVLSIVVIPLCIVGVLLVWLTLP